MGLFRNSESQRPGIFNMCKISINGTFQKFCLVLWGVFRVLREVNARVREVNARVSSRFQHTYILKSQSPSLFTIYDKYKWDFSEILSSLQDS
jgi:hypothetical protein